MSSKRTPNGAAKMKTLARLAVAAFALSCPAGLVTVASAVAVCFVLDVLADVVEMSCEFRSIR
jgi:hypothetical protein